MKKLILALFLLTATFSYSNEVPTFELCKTNKIRKHGRESQNKLCYKTAKQASFWALKKCDDANYSDCKVVKEVTVKDHFKPNECQVCVTVKFEN